MSPTLRMDPYEVPRSHRFLMPLLNGAQVQGEAQGSEDALHQFVQQLHQGPSAATVTNVEKNDMTTKSGEQGFSVK